ncbi:MAG: hypothetical protein EXR69_12520 [Myxococcales bacterium]|nr:hypothetical protein [Myxococcales bacterium]
MGQTFAASTKSADAPDIEAGLYDGRLDSIEVKYIEGGQYGDGDRFVWTFTLLDDDGSVLYGAGDSIEVDALTSMSLNTKSKTTPKAVRFFKALATEAEFAAFENGDPIDSDALVGRTAQVDVYLRDSGWPSIANVLPKRKARKARPTAATTEDDE